MMQEKRPNPDKLLQRVQEDELKTARGKLKIYLGAAPGVGKTHSMLQDALAVRASGLDVVIGIVESHCRKEIEAMCVDFESLPRQTIDYHGKQLFEFDLDAALKRQPGLILIDEMAHTNVPGLRHAKRWQDIKELIDRGIDVYTTLNVQHIESLNDNIAQIIHAPIKETVPDSMIELADTIELVDISPEDLLKRLSEGKIYFPSQAKLAAEHFFVKGNLIALRELALRTTAKLVGTQVLLHRQGQGISQIWPTKEKILVCVGPGPEAMKLIRAARRMAANWQAEWIAVYVETLLSKQSEEKRNNGIQNLRFAEKLGAETRILSGLDVVTEVLNFARENNVTQVMIWKYIRTRWIDFFIRNLADEMVRYSGDIDVYIMTGKLGEFQQQKTEVTKPRIPWPSYIVSCGAVGLATMLNFLLHPLLASSNLVMVYLLGVTLVALFGQVGPSILASILSLVAYDFFFVPPFYSFFGKDLGYIFTFLVMSIVAYVISYSNIVIRRQAMAARLIESQTSALYKLSRQLASTRGIDKLLKTGIRYIADQFDSNVVAFIPEGSSLEVRSKSNPAEILDEKEKSIAQWVYDLEQVAGLGTDTLPGSNALYVPLLGPQGALGVLRVRPNHQELLTPAKMHSLEACINQIAVAIEAARSNIQVSKSKLTNEIRGTLLESIAHDLRTPLASIMVSASTQIDLAKQLTPTKIKELGKSIYFESAQLSRLINNFLQITYFESNPWKLNKKPCVLADLINTAIQSSDLDLGNRPINLHLQENLPRVPVDGALMQEVFINLLDNAVKLSPPRSPIEIFAVHEQDKVIVSVEDSGPGIMLDESEKLFEKFYRGRQLTTERGLGLGLAICKKIIEAHGGEIWAENRKEGGAAFRFTVLLTNKGSE